MLDKFKGMFGRNRPADPVAAAASRVFEQHQAELMEQMQTFVQEQSTNPAAASSASANAGEEGEPTAPTYTDFVRQRRGSIARKLAADLSLQEWQENLSRVQVVEEIRQKLTQPRAHTLNAGPAQAEDSSIIDQYLERLDGRGQPYS